MAVNQNTTFTLTATRGAESLDSAESWCEPSRCGAELAVG